MYNVYLSYQVLGFGF